MDIVEIILLVVGGIIFLLSFILPDRKESGGENAGALAEDEMKKLVNREMESIKSHVDDVVEEAVTYAMEKTERSLERLSNEKIMAVSEYSDTVLAEIHKNHEEAMFLYDMLNSKHINLKNTVSEINRTVKEAEETVTSFQKLAPEVVVPQPEAETVEIEQPEAKPPANKTSGGRNQSKKGSSRKNASKRGAGNKASSGGSTAVQNVSGPEREAGGNEAKFSQEGNEQEDQGQEGQNYNNNEKILELCRQGKSAIEIAKELELGIGEVKLVLDLFEGQ